MGGTASEAPLFCKYNKQTFNKRINIIKDAHKIVQHYANYLLQEKMPIQLPEYKNFGEDSETYFNTRRKDSIPELTATNPKIANYYDFYNGLSNLQREYEKGDITQAERRSKVLEVMLTAQVVLQLLIEELYQSCDGQGRPPTGKESTATTLTTQSNSTSE